MLLGAQWLRNGHIMYGRVATDAPRKAARRRHRPCRRILRLCYSSLSDPLGTIFANVDAKARRKVL